jgi:hypothetical protein
VTISITISGEVFKAKEYNCCLSSVSIGDKTQTRDGTDHIETRRLKRSISMKLSDVKRADGKRLLHALYSTEYLQVTYFDPYDDIEETRTFILQNDPAMQMKIWKKNLQYYDGIAVELKEKGATV